MSAVSFWKNKGIKTMILKEHIMLGLQHPYCDVKLHHEYAVQLEKTAKMEYEIAESFLRQAELIALMEIC
jgi:hypothetical protein